MCTRGWKVGSRMFFYLYYYYSSFILFCGWWRRAKERLQKDLQRFFFAKRGKNQLKEAEEKRCTIIFLKSLNEQCWKHTLPPPHMRGLDGKQMY